MESHVRFLPTWILRRLHPPRGWGCTFSPHHICKRHHLDEVNREHKMDPSSTRRMGGCEGKESGAKSGTNDVCPWIGDGSRCGGGLICRWSGPRFWQIRSVQQRRLQIMVQRFRWTHARHVVTCANPFRRRRRLPLQCIDHP